MNGRPAQNHRHQQALLADVCTFLSCTLLFPQGASVLFSYFSVQFFTDLEIAQDPTSVSGKFNLHMFFRLNLRSVWLWEPLKNASQNCGSTWIRPKDIALGAIGKPREAKPIKKDLQTCGWNRLDVHTFKLLRHDIVAVGSLSVAELRRLRWYPQTNAFWSWPVTNISVVKSF